MTDPKALAEKILAIVRNPDTLHESHINMAATLLREALEEASGAHSPIANARASNAIYYATLTAYDECAEIAEQHNGCVDTECLSKSNCGATIANQIRLRKSEVIGEKIGEKK